jgi:hypothetical protein
MAVWRLKYLTCCRQLNPNVIRIPIVPGSDPRKAYGDLAARGVRGVVLETFGVGNMPDTREAGWLPWLRSQRKKGLHVRPIFYLFHESARNVVAVGSIRVLAFLVWC